MEVGVQTPAAGASWASCGLHHERGPPGAWAAYRQAGSKAALEGTGQRAPGPGAAVAGEASHLGTSALGAAQGVERLELS